MNLKTIYILVIVFNVLSCSSSIKSEKKSKAHGKTSWGFVDYHVDTLGNHYKYIYSDRTCFPGVAEFENDIAKFEITIYDRFGKLVYSSTNKYENWICQDSLSATYKPGAYFYQVIYSTTEEPSIIDTLRNQLRIIIK